MRYYVSIRRHGYPDRQIGMNRKELEEFIDIHFSEMTVPKYTAVGECPYYEKIRIMQRNKSRIKSGFEIIVLWTVADCSKYDPSHTVTFVPAIKEVRRVSYTPFLPNIEYDHNISIITKNIIKNVKGVFLAGISEVEDKDC